MERSWAINKIRSPLLLLIILQKIDHLCLNGHIQGGDRLITDDQLRLQHQCTGDTDSLPLATGKFMCITAGMLLCQADSVPASDKRSHPLRSFSLRSHAATSGSAMISPHCHTGIQGSVGILKDHLHLFPERLQLLLASVLVISFPSSRILPVCHIVHPDDRAAHRWIFRSRTRLPVPVSSLSAMVKLTPSTAWTICFPDNLKCLVRFSTSSMFSPLIDLFLTVSMDSF